MNLRWFRRQGQSAVKVVVDEQERPKYHISDKGVLYVDPSELLTSSTVQSQIAALARIELADTDTPL